MSCQKNPDSRPNMCAQTSCRAHHCASPYLYCTVRTHTGTGSWTTVHAKQHACEYSSCMQVHTHTTIMYINLHHTCKHTRSYLMSNIIQQHVIYNYMYNYTETYSMLTYYYTLTILAHAQSAWQSTSIIKTGLHGYKIGPGVILDHSIKC